MSGSLSGVGLTCCCALDGAVFSNMAAATVTYLLLLLLIFFFPSITKTWKPQVVFLPENISELTILNFQKVIGLVSRALHLDGDESHRVNLKPCEQHSPTQLFKKVLPHQLWINIIIRNLNLSVTLLCIVWSLYSSQQQGEIFLFFCVKAVISGSETAEFLAMKT